MKINTANAEIGTTLTTEILVLESQKKKIGIEDWGLAQTSKFYVFIFIFLFYIFHILFLFF